jgi:uncharacterized protein (DUF427 family)
MAGSLSWKRRGAGKPRERSRGCCELELETESILATLDGVHLRDRRPRYTNAMSDADIPAWARAARQGWTWTGGARPPFAEVPSPGQESVWDYPRPPLLVPDARSVVVRRGETELARTDRAVRMLETSHPPTFYLPRSDVVMKHLKRTGHGSQCEWKGLCTYYDVVVGGERIVGAAWSYEEPLADAAAIAGHIAFYASRLACFVAGERALPQPGGFYGGWVTAELVGPFKGGPDSRGW